MRIYHGSENIIEKPEYGKGKTTNDYGRGFYCTKSQDLAKEWACGNDHNGFANAYDFDVSGLKVLKLNEPPFNLLNWLAVLTAHRTYWENGAISRQAKEYLQQHFGVDLSPYDFIIGYRANDSYFSFARSFVANAISLRKLSEAMRLGNLGEQVVLKSQSAFEKIHFAGYEEAASDIYYPMKSRRDKDARMAYRRSLSEPDTEDDLYMVDIMREKMENGDPRLRSGLFG